MNMFFRHKLHSSIPLIWWIDRFIVLLCRFEDEFQQAAIANNVLRTKIKYTLLIHVFIGPYERNSAKTNLR